MIRPSSFVRLSRTRDLSMRNDSFRLGSSGTRNSYGNAYTLSRRNSSREVRVKVVETATGIYLINNHGAHDYCADLYTLNSRGEGPKQKRRNPLFLQCGNCTICRVRDSFASESAVELSIDAQSVIIARSAGKSCFSLGRCSPTCYPTEHIVLPWGPNFMSSSLSFPDSAITG